MRLRRRRPHRLHKVASESSLKAAPWGGGPFALPSSPGGTPAQHGGANEAQSARVHDTIGLGELTVDQEPLGLGHSLPISIEARACGDTCFDSLQRFYSGEKGAEACLSPVPSADSADSGKLARRRHIFRPCMMQQIVAAEDAVAVLARGHQVCDGQQALQIDAADASSSGSDRSTGEAAGDDDATPCVPVRAAACVADTPFGEVSAALSPAHGDAWRPMQPQLQQPRSDERAELDGSASASSSAHSSVNLDSGKDACLTITSAGEVMPLAQRSDMLATSLAPGAPRAESRHAPSRARSMIDAPVATTRDPADCEFSVERSQSAGGGAPRRWSLRDAFDDLASRHAMLAVAVAHDDAVEDAAERVSSIERTSGVHGGEPVAGDALAQCCSPAGAFACILWRLQAWLCTRPRQCCIRLVCNVMRVCACVCAGQRHMCPAVRMACTHQMFGLVHCAHSAGFCNRILCLQPRMCSTPAPPRQLHMRRRLRSGAAQRSLTRPMCSSQHQSRVSSASTSLALMAAPPPRTRQRSPRRRRRQSACMPRALGRRLQAATALQVLQLAPLMTRHLRHLWPHSFRRAT